VHLRPATVEQYRVRLRLRMLPTLGALPLTSITRDTIRTLLGEMIKGGNYRSKGRPAARGTIQAALRTLSAILTTAEEDGLIPVNPTRRMGKHVAPTGADEAHEIEVFDRAELSRLLSLAERDWPEHYPFLLSLARAGLRLGEAIALEWRDIDWANRIILVRRTRRRNRVSEPKSGRARRVDMSQQLADVLRGLRTLQEAEGVVAGQAPPERVFSDRTGGPIQEDGFRNNVWTPLLRRAQLRYRKPHTLRHTFASMLLEAGEPATYVQQQLGHHSAAFTFKVYGHLLPRGSRRGVDVLDDATIRNPAATGHASVPSLFSFSR
jgi:integrase